MTLAVSQTATRVLTDAGGATTNISFGSLPTAGHGVNLYLVDGVASNPTLDPTSVVDNQGVSNLYQKAKSAVETSAGQLAWLGYCESIGATSGTFTVTVTHASSSGNYSILGMTEANGPIQLSGTPTSTNQTGGTGFTLTCPAFSGSDALLTTAMTVDSSTGSNNIANSSSFASAMIEQDSTAHVVGSGDNKAVAASTNMVYTYAAGSTDAVGVMAAFIPKTVAATIQHVDYMRRNHPGRGPYSKGAYRRPRIDAYSDAVAPTVYVPPNPIEDTRRNRPGRGPYSLGAYFRPRVDAFTNTAVSASVTAAGGLTFGGTAATVFKRIAAAAGGLQLGGASAFAKGQTIVPAGGLIFAGSSAAIRVRVKSATGGIVFGGAATESSSGTQQLSYSASGGLSFGGASTEARVHVVSAAGGLSFGGASAESAHEQRRTVSAAGGLSFGGSSASNTFSFGATGNYPWWRRVRR
jgi:hypothetical protein